MASFPESFSDGQGLACQLHAVSRAELPATTGFDFTVDADIARLDQNLGLSTASHEVVEFEELIETDRFG
jgi:hypothetical protein